ncbi:MAG: cytochrome b6f subunit family protein, partial [Cyanobacteria bacterium P01_H01_bin.130]
MIEIGQSVKVKRLRDRMSKDQVASIKQNPVGTV